MYLHIVNLALKSELANLPLAPNTPVGVFVIMAASSFQKATLCHCYGPYLLKGLLNSVPFVRPCWGSLKICIAAVGCATCACPIVFGMEMDTAPTQMPFIFARTLYGTTLLAFKLQFRQVDKAVLNP